MSSEQPQPVLELALYGEQGVARATVVRLAPDTEQTLSVPQNLGETVDGDCACIVLDEPVLTPSDSKFYHAEERKEQSFGDEPGEEEPRC